MERPKTIAHGATLAMIIFSDLKMALFYGQEYTKTYQNPL